MEAAHKVLILWRITINHDVNNHLKINFEMSDIVKFDYSKSFKMLFYAPPTIVEGHYVFWSVPPFVRPVKVFGRGSF